MLNERVMSSVHSSTRLRILSFVFHVKTCIIHVSSSLSAPMAPRVNTDLILFCFHGLPLIREVFVPDTRDGAAVALEVASNGGRSLSREQNTLKRYVLNSNQSTEKIEYSTFIYRPRSVSDNLPRQRFLR